MASTDSGTGNLEGVAAAAAQESQHIPQPVATSTPESGIDSVAATRGRREKSNPQPSCSGTRTYSEILCRRPIHSPRSNKTPKKPSPTKTTPKTPKSCKTSKLQSKNRLEFEKTPLQSTAKRQKVEPETNSPPSAGRRTLSLIIKEGPVTRRRSLYPRRSPRTAVKAEAEEQSINNDKAASLPKRRCLELPKVEAPKEEESCRRLPPDNEVKLIDISLAASCSSTRVKPQKVESRIVPQGQGQSKVEPIPLDNGAAESNQTDIPAPAAALALNPDTVAAPDPKIDTKENILKPDEQVVDVSIQSLESVHSEIEMETDGLQATQVDSPEATTEFQELQLNNTSSSEDTIAPNPPKKGCILM